ncbi:TPA: HIT family protein [Candidatus Woesearchaeota archaeon]|nr:HIT family protein [Candidatus Woesearchaeota archaeon]HII68611.1 HIT family protein [Candidatus Woesearchaeota archaeon]
MEGCIFCSIIKGKIPCAKIYEDGEVIALLDINPVNKGHALVLPKEHVHTLTDASDELLAKVMSAAKKIAFAIVRTTGAEGFNILQNNHKAAGQMVPHLHFHIIPRFERDKRFESWPHESYAKGEADRIKEGIVKFL